MRSILLALLLAAPAAAQIIPAGWKPVTGGHWGGLNILQDSTAIDGDAQVANNVLTDSGYLEKRPGNTWLTTILSSSPVQYANDWASPSGTRYLIAQASQTIYQTNFSTTPVALSTISVGFNLTTVPAFSKLEFADGFRSLWSWDGNSTATIVSAGGAASPICTYIAFKDSRIWCGNLPNGFTTAGNTTNGGGASTVLISSAGGDGYWAVPSNVGLVDSVPNRFDFNPDDGDQITCMANTPWGMYVGKRNSSFIVKGSGNLSYDPRLLDSKIGCVDNRSVQMVYGVLEWLAVDGVYGYDGSGPPKLLSRELDPLMAQIRESSFSQGQWATQLQSDWAAGTTSSAALQLPPFTWDFNTVPGSVFPSSFTLYDDNRSPQLQGGAGFSSDTLVNIDTMTAPLSVGYAQLSPSISTGIRVWSSDFTGGSFTTGASTWTISNGGPIGAGNGGIYGSLVHLSGARNNRIFTMAASSQISSSNGWNFGSWQVSWTPEDVANTDYGRCRSDGVNPCMEYDFISNGPTFTWNGYGIRVDGDQNTYTLQLFKSILGVQTVLNSATFTLPLSGSPIPYTIFNITKTVGGHFQVYVDGVLAITADDINTTANKAVFTTLHLNSFFTPGIITANFSTGTFFNGYPSSGTIVSRIFNTGMGSPLAGVVSSSFSLQGTGNQTEMDFYLRSSTSPNNDMWTSYAASSSGVLAVLPLRYWQYKAIFTTQISSYTPQLQTFSLAAVSTGSYFSKVNFIGNLITSWRQFGITENTLNTYKYYVRQATYSFLSSDTSIAWTLQAPNQNVNLSISTPTYAQFRIDSTPLATNPLGASAAEPVIAVFVRWNQGANLPVASDTLDRRYFLCVTISTTATAPDVCLVRQKNNKWVKWLGPSIGAMGYYNNQMIAADGGASSKIWQIMQPGIYSDDGTAIDAVWVSQDFTSGDIFNNKVLHEGWIDLLPMPQQGLYMSYAVDESSAYINFPICSDNGNPVDTKYSPIMGLYGEMNTVVPLVQDGYSVGNEFRVKFEDNTIDDYFRVNAYLLYTETQPRSIPAYVPGP